MNKKLVTIISACLVGATFVGCGQTSTNNEINQNNNTVVEVVDVVDGSEFSSEEIQHIFNLTKNDLKDKFGKATYEGRMSAVNGHEVHAYSFSDLNVMAGIGDSGKVEVLTVLDNSIEHIRGIKIGDSLESVISKFKNDFNSDLSALKKIDEWDGGHYVELYGDLTEDDIYDGSPLKAMGYILYTDFYEGFTEITLKDNYTEVSISIRDGVVSSISYLS